MGDTGGGGGACSGGGGMGDRGGGVSAREVSASVPMPRPNPSVGASEIGRDIEDLREDCANDCARLSIGFLSFLGGGRGRGSSAAGTSGLGALITLLEILLDRTGVGE